MVMTLPSTNESVLRAEARHYEKLRNYFFSTFERSSGDCPLSCLTSIEQSTLSKTWLTDRTATKAEILSKADPLGGGDGSPGRLVARRESKSSKLAAQASRDVGENSRSVARTCSRSRVSKSTTVTASSSFALATQSRDSSVMDHRAPAKNSITTSGKKARNRTST